MSLPGDMQGLGASKAEMSQALKDAGDTFNALASTANDKRTALLTAHRAITKHFNDIELTVAEGSRSGAFQDAEWKRFCVETASDALEMYPQIFERLREWALPLAIPPETFLPSQNAFATTQRFIAREEPARANALMNQFMKQGLPAAGFMTAAAETAEPGEAVEEVEPGGVFAAEQEAIAEPVAAEAFDELLPTDWLAGLPLSELANGLLEIAWTVAEKHGGAPLTTSFLLAAIAEYGRDGLDSSAALLYQHLAAINPKCLDTIRFYLQWYRGRDWPGGSEKMTSYAADVLERARELAIRTTLSQELGARHLLGALLVYSRTPTNREPGVRTLLDRLGADPRVLCRELLDYLEENEPVGGPGDDLEAWRRELGLEEPTADAAISGEVQTPAPPDTRPDKPAPSGKFALGWQRDASDAETALNVDEIASALLATLDSTNGEVCFGLFGHWGRGKTHLMRRVAGLMPKARGHRYEVVWFSAWKYPHVPQVWVHLYESLAARAYEGSAWHSIPRVVRSNVHRRGLWLLLGQFLLAAVLMIPLSQWLGLLRSVIAVVGLWGALGIIKVARALIAPARRLEATYMSQVSHRDKLGLQETIGNDLHALLDGWLDRERTWWFTIKHALVYWLALGAVAVGLWFGLQKHPLWVRTVVEVAWLASGIFTARWLWCVGRDTQRVLLIVDDLDRCEPEHMSTVIESLKLLVEDEKLQGRVQVVALVEEEILRWAIERRFDRLVPGARQDKELDRLVAEHLQKLFIGHMRLPSLRDDELAEVLDKYLGERIHTATETALPETPASNKTGHSGDRKRVDAKPPPTNDRGGQSPQPVPTGSYGPGPANAAAKIAQRNESMPPVAAAPEATAVSLDELEHTGASFSREEHEALKQALPELARYEHARPGPRALRSFLLQYQLARLLLLAHAHTRVPPRTLIAALLQGHSDEASGSGEQDVLRAVVSMVRPWVAPGKRLSGTDPAEA